MKGRTVMMHWVLSLLVFFSLGGCFFAVGADSEEQKRHLIRAYVNLRMNGCDTASLQNFAKALTGITDTEAFAIGLVINGLGWASLQNHALYKASYELLMKKDAASPHLIYLTGTSVTEACATCGGAGDAKQTCKGCAGLGGLVTALNETTCPQCRGSGRTPVPCATCRVSGQVFSSAKARQTFQSFLRQAEDSLTRIFGDLGKHLSPQDASRYTAFKAEEELDENSYTASVELSQVLPDGALAYVISSSPRIGVDSSVSRALIYIKHLPRGLADGDGWEGKLYLIGTYRYLTRADYTKTVKLFSADKTTAARLLIAKRNNAGADDARPDNARRRNSPGEESDEEEGTSMGTGWLTAHGYVVTCYHVIKGHRKVFIKSQKIEKMPVKVVSKDSANDLAILKPDKLTGLPPGLPISGRDLVLAQKVFTLGYPQTQLLGDALKFTDGTVSALSGLHDDARCIQISVPVQSGNSGGPLINTSGEVVGVIVSKLAAINVFKWTGDLPENVNYAVRTDYAKPLLGAQEKREFPLLEAKQAEMEEQVRRLSDSVVMVIAE